MNSQLRMKLVTVGFAAILLGGSLANAAESVFYTFDELPIGSTLAENEPVADTSGNNNHALAHNGPMVVAGRLGGSAINFTGNQFLDSTLDLNGDWTFETQIKTDSENQHFRYMLGRDTHATAILEFRVNSHDPPGELGLKWEAPPGEGGRLESWNVGPVIDDDQWHHVAVSVNAATSTMKVYVDFTEVNSVLNAGFDGVTTPALHQIGNYSVPGAGGVLDGPMDFLRITDSVLLPAEFFDGSNPLPNSSKFTWKFDGSGDWQDRNWDFDSAPIPLFPNDKEHTASFSDAITSTNTVFTNSRVTASIITFDNANSYVLAGRGGVSIEAGSAGASVLVLEGEHEFQTPVDFLTNAEVQVTGGSTLIFNNAVNLNGNTLTKSGGGELAIRNDFTTGGGTVDIVGGTVTGSGTIGGEVINGGVISPGNSSTSVGVPEPGSFVLVLVAMAGWFMMRRNRADGKEL